MLWNDVMIMDNGRDLLDPFDPDLVQPASIDVTLDREFYISTWSMHHADPSVNNDRKFEKKFVPKGEPLVLRPGAFALASTYERVTLPRDVAARYEGKSSLGRLGLFTHVTAGFIDPGFEGHITLELFNALPVSIDLYPGMKIGQLCFMDMATPPEFPYGSAAAGSHYQGQRGPTLSRSHEKFSIKDVYKKGAS